MNQPLAEIIFWIAAVACVVAEIAILRSTFVVVRRATKSDSVPSSSQAGELVWAFIPAVALSVVLVATWQRIEARQGHMMQHSGMNHTMPMPSSPETMR
jgi:heme/copper-type cytochrome/quinol oxidase subunit 2